MNSNELFPQLMTLYHEVDKAFQSMKENYPDAVCCKTGCADCCHACFDISLAEALLLQKALQSLPVEQLMTLKKRASDTQQEYYQLESEMRSAKDDAGTLMSHRRLKCPLLGADKSCEVYEVRPVTCRAYGLPTSFNGRGHVCGFSGFTPGTEYPTIKLDTIHTYLFNLSEQAVQAFQLDKGLAERRYFIHDIVLEENL